MKERFEILFIAKHPATSVRTDGFLNRINEIDNLFCDSKKLYLDITPKLKSFKKQEFHFENTTIIRLNIFSHFFQIIKHLNNAERLYIHSVYMGFRIFPHIYFARIKAKVCFELHGVFEEELKYKGEKLRSKFYHFIEKKLVKLADILVFVSKPFEQYYLEKYPDTKNKTRFIIPTCNSKVFAPELTSKVDGIKKKYNIQGDDVVLIYSGNIEKWQKIELTLEIMSKLYHSKANFKFFLLTGNPDRMAELAKDFNLPIGERAFILQLEPEDLMPFYEISHYGFVLRDDSIVNRVSSPTKLLEYLYFGIIPVMLSTKIGFFEDFDCDYLPVNEIFNIDKPRKSEKNRQIAREIMQNYYNELEKLKSTILG